MPCPHRRPPARAAAAAPTPTARPIAALLLLLCLPALAAAAAHVGREFRPGDFLPSARRMQYHGVSA
jgi:hypothetical protein